MYQSQLIQVARLCRLLHGSQFRKPLPPSACVTAEVSENDAELTTALKGLQSRGPTAIGCELPNKTLHVG
jgi:hypothetical protein